MFSLLHRAVAQYFQLIVPQGRLTQRQESSCAGPSVALAFWLAWCLTCSYDQGPRLWYRIIHEQLVSLWTVLSSKRNVFYQHLLVAHSTHILCKWEAIGNEDDKGATCILWNSQVKMRLVIIENSKCYHLISNPGESLCPHPVSLLEEHAQGCEQNLTLVLGYLNDSTSIVFDTMTLTILFWKTNCSCIRLSTEMNYVAQRSSEGDWQKRNLLALDILQVPHIWGSFLYHLCFSPGFK